MFDLPVTKVVDRRRATKFRNFLLDEGFSMSQFSVYLRFCGTRERVYTYKKKLKNMYRPMVMSAYFVLRISNTAKL